MGESLNDVDRKKKVALSRRSFLKSSGLAVAASVAGAAAQAEAHTADPGATAFPTDDLVSLVNILQGTESEHAFSRGNTLPIAARPFGMAHWTLENRAHSSWMFQPHDRRLHGFRSTHQLSPWLGDYGHASFLPVSFESDNSPKLEPGDRASSYRPEEARLAPHSLSLRLLRYGIDAELIPTERCAVLTAAYSKASPGLLFDIPGDAAPEVGSDRTRRTIHFTSSANGGGVAPGFATYYVLRFAEPWQSFEMKPLKGHHVGVIRLDSGAKYLDVRIGTSFISFAQAERNLDLETAANPPATLRQEGASAWNQQLATIELSGATLTQQRTFYSCLYRVLLFPRMWHELDAQGTVVHRSPYNGRIVPGVMYADHGYWDVYRAWYPLMTILFPARLAEILQAWVNAYREGGWLPQFPCPGYRACMTGSLIDSVFGDAAAKGISGFDLATAYAGLKKHATERGNPDAGWGRRGIEEYLKYGYAPAGLVDQSAAETVDAAYGDFCIAQVAKALGHQQDTALFLARSTNWRKLFDPQTGFLRGKKVDGTFVEPFDPVRWGDPYVEGAAWQHRWDVPHDVDGLFAALGGPAQAVAALEEMLTRPADFDVGAYDSEIHEMSEMAALRFGQYAHSNQPVHHVLYLFTLAGRPDRTRFWTRRIMDELYTPDTFAGDEDTGSMAAWYLLSALGFYPVCPGKPEYVLGGALFPQATVHLPQGRTLLVERPQGVADHSADNNSARQAAATFNGQPLGTTISHTQVTGGGHLIFSA